MIVIEMRRLLKEFVQNVLNEAENDTKYLEKINFRKLHQLTPDIDSKELQQKAKEGPIFEKATLSYISRLSDAAFPRENRKQYVKWLANSIRVGDWPPEQAVRYVSDYVNGLNVPISSLPLQFDSAYALSREWHESLKTKNFDKEIEASGNEKIVHEFSDGFKILELSADDCRAEGPSMGNCVATYADDVTSSEVKIFSLRDPRNKPHVTISMNGKNFNVVQEIKGQENKVPIQKYAVKIKEWLGLFNYDTSESFDYFEILTNEEKRSFLASKKKTPRSYLQEFWAIASHEDYRVNDFNPPRPTNLSNLPIKTLTKAWVGVAKSFVGYTYRLDQADLFKLLETVSTWASGLTSNLDVSDAIKSLRSYAAGSSGLTRYYGQLSSERVSATVEIPRPAIWDFGYIIKGVLDAGVTPEYVIECIEKEIGMPLEDFLFKD